MSKKRTLDHESIMDRWDSGERIVDIAKDLGKQPGTISNIVQKYRPSETLSAPTGKNMRRTMGVTVGCVTKTLDKELSNDEWYWLLDQVNNKHRSLAEIFAKMIKQQARVDGKASV